MEPRLRDESSTAMNEAQPPGGEPDRAGGGRQDPGTVVRETEILTLDSSFSIDEFLSEEAEEQPARREPESEPALAIAPPPPPFEHRVPLSKPAAADHMPARAPVWEPRPQQEDAVPALQERTVAGAAPFPKKPDGDDAAISLAELLENAGPVDWPEAVAIAQKICRAVGRHTSSVAQQYNLDARHVEITEHGDVHILPGGPGGDPLVKQVGRILRSLLDGGTAPLQLRLIASQAAFEFPGFATVGELAETLRTFEQTPESEAIRMAFKRAIEARLSTPEDRVQRLGALAAPSLPIQPVPAWTDLVQKTAGSARYHHAPLAVMSVVLVALLTYLSVKWMGVSGERSQPAAARVAASPPPAAAKAEPEPAIVTIVTIPPPAPVTTPTPSIEQRREPARVIPPRVEPPAPVNRPPVDAGRKPIAPPPVERAVAPMAPAPVDRGRALIAPAPVEGPDQQVAEKNVFDSIVLANPLYQLDPGRSTPQAMAMLRASKRTILPSIARRDYDKARAFLEAGDNEAALSEGSRVMRMLDDDDIGPMPAGLRESVVQLISRAAAAKAREDELVYSVEDASVTPPTAIGRQLPASPPTGLANQLVGTLEMVISQEGEVEAVRLHTPLNRYHERMIVSAAKAWRYRPAVKNGKPVRFRLFSSINLPES